MKRTNYFILAVAAFAALVGCVKEEQNGDTPESQFLTVIAAVDGAVVKTWNSGDVIKVVCGEEMYDFKTSETAANAKFIQSEEKLTAEMIGDAGVAAFANCRTMYGAFNISPEQTWAAGTSSVVIPAYAYTMNAPVDNVLALDFNALASVIELTFTPYAMTVQSLKLEAAEDATITDGALAGAFKVVAEAGTVTATTANNELTVTFDGGLDVSQGAVVKIPVGWCKIAGGLKATVTYDDTKEYIATVLESENIVKTFDDASGFKKATVLPATFEFDVNAFPRTWYVSPDGSSDALGVKEAEPTTLSVALEQALAGSVIKLAAGTYTPDTVYPGMEGDAHKTFLVKRNVTIEGVEGAVIDGMGTSLHAMVVYAEKKDGEKVVLKNFTVKNTHLAQITEPADYILQAGEVPDDNVLLPGTVAAGVAIGNSVVEMNNVVLTENKGTKAPALYAFGSDITMTNCEVSKNEAFANCGGVWFTNKCNVVVDGCTLTENKAELTAGAMFVNVPLSAENGELAIEIKNTVFSKNSSLGNGGSLYIADETGKGNLEFGIDGCTFQENRTEGMGYVILISVSGTIKNSLIENNTAVKNGGFYHYTDTNNEVVTNVLFDNCEFRGNVANLGPGIYSYNQAGEYNIYVTNSLFKGQTTTGRGSYYVRNNAAGAFNAYAVNTTFEGNEAKQGTAINVYGAAAKPVTMNVIGCTVVNNNSTSTSAIYSETAGAHSNIYNSIVSGNTNGDAGAKADAGTIAYYNSIIGSDFYAENAVQTVTPVWDVTTMISVLGNDGTCKLVGDASSNPAFGNGMTVAALSALATDVLPASVLTVDQLGNARTDADKIIGACVK